VHWFLKSVLICSPAPVLIKTWKIGSTPLWRQTSLWSSTKLLLPWCHFGWASFHFRSVSLSFTIFTWSQWEQIDRRTEQRATLGSRSEKRHLLSDKPFEYSNDISKSLEQLRLGSEERQHKFDWDRKDNYRLANSLDFSKRLDSRGGARLDSRDGHELWSIAELNSPFCNSNTFFRRCTHSFASLWSTPYIISTIRSSTVWHSGIRRIV
jgi:hypothetical protein